MRSGRRRLGWVLILTIGMAVLPSAQADNGMSFDSRITIRWPHAVATSGVYSDGWLLPGVRVPQQTGIHRFAVAKVRHNSLDPSFSGDGRRIVTFSKNKPEGAVAGAIDAQGRYVVGGTTARGFALTRIQPNGALDRSFGKDGKVVVRLGTYDYDAFLTTLFVLPDSRILAAGIIDHGAEWGDLFVRFNPDGSLDGSFGDEGVLELELPGETPVVALQKDGRILVAGLLRANEDDPDFLVIRLLPDGSYDPSFSNDGLFHFDIVNGGESARSLLVDEKGRIVVAGTGASETYGSPDYVIARVSPTGKLDSTFGDNGGRVISFFPPRCAENCAGSPEELDGIMLDDQGRILMVGSTVKYGDPNRAGLALVRLDPDGDLDPTFGSGGKTMVGYRSIDVYGAALTGRKLRLASVPGGGYAQLSSVRLAP